MSARRLDRLLRSGGALLVAAVAAYSSYVHQRSFALMGGADAVSATLWPLSVDGLLLLATVGLLRLPQGAGRRQRCVVWLSFLLGIAVSLAANIAAAPSLSWRPVLVAGWPPVALLLAVELLGRPSPGAAVCAAGDREAEDDPLLGRALREDARHREAFQRPISAETLRKELHIGAVRARELVASVRASQNGGLAAG